MRGFGPLRGYDLDPTHGHEVRDGLREIADFLDHNRGEVVTIIFEAYVDPAATEAAFEEAGLLERVYRPAAGAR